MVAGDELLVHRSGGGERSFTIGFERDQVWRKLGRRVGVG